MPRERIHWELIHQATAELGLSSGFGKILSEQPRLALLGAVLPDAPYYHRRGKDPRSGALGEFLHGRHGEDTFAPLRHWSSHIQQTPLLERTKSWALWAGFLSHCIVDQVFHPMVYWHTGDYYALDHAARSSARTRHRIFEVYLDSSVSAHSTTFGRTLPKCISDITSAADWNPDGPLPLFCRSLFATIQEVPELMNGEAQTLTSFTHSWQESLADLSQVQRLAMSPYVGGFLALSALLSRSQSLREISALCAFRRSLEPSSYTRRTRYQNPVTGALLEASPQDLMQQALNQFIEELRRCEGFLGDSSSQPHAPLSVEGGSSLAYGIYGSTDHDGKYFSPILGLMW